MLCTSFYIYRCRTARQPLIKCHLGGRKTEQLVTTQFILQGSFCLRVCRSTTFSPLIAEASRAFLSHSGLALLSLSCLPSDGVFTWPCSHSSKDWRQSWRMIAASDQGNSLTSCVKLLSDTEERRWLINLCL